MLGPCSGTPIHRTGIFTEVGTAGIYLTRQQQTDMFVIQLGHARAQRTQSLVWPNSGHPTVQVLPRLNYNGTPDSLNS